ncbi:hypothetical protein Hamer_G015313 [Homarus americanus]|uniref:Uncharacterized protein n=1 Tax=Homarus americanus TaxID=6706 RepID=A0A8J5N846_HOMAM|nr:hypothetical protein Hamer_G015313 [Homarus americanus]
MNRLFLLHWSRGRAHRAHLHRWRKRLRSRGRPPARTTHTCGSALPEIWKLNLQPDPHSHMFPFSRS